MKTSISNKETINDAVNNPSHYTSGGIECIDAMEAAYGSYAVMDFCKCNAFKYIFRFAKKNGIEDLKKAKWYIDKYIELDSDSKPNIQNLKATNLTFNVPEENK